LARLDRRRAPAGRDAARSGERRRRLVLAGLDHVQVAAPPGCEQEARRFYGELLGLDEVAKPASLAAAGGVWFACGAQGLHVGVAEDCAPATKAHPGLRVTNSAALDELAERLRAAGAPVERDDRLPGHRRFYTRDPWGNRVELLARA
ncbi:MAG: VOC family protein, partial [Gaiellaceae bacterium]